MHIKTICKILLVWTHVWHFKTISAVGALESLEDATLDAHAAHLAANASEGVFMDFPNTDGDTEIIEARDISTTAATHTENEKSRRRTARQIFYNPNLIFLQNFGAEGSKCITTQGMAGVCVNFGSCQQYYRTKRQLGWYALRQWPLHIPMLGTEICSYYDQFGRANTGMCCVNNNIGGGEADNGFGPPFLLPAPAQPIPAPPPATEEPPPAKGEKEDTDDDDRENTDDILDIDDNSPDFLDENNVSNDINPMKDDNPIAMTYDDRFPWSSQFAGHFGGINQWPPPIPTHPPSVANWPPPIPTHPPGHHYPTHPASSAAVTRPPATTTRKPASTIQTTTRRPAPTTTTTRRTTTITSRRPSYPSYPAYPGYPPSYPGFPQYHPTTRPTNRPTYAPTTTTTTRRPSAPAGGGGDVTTAHGLPQQCGIKNPVSPDQERIVGGTNASPHEFPWIAVLFKAGKQFCGGSLITNNHILTAAHCVSRFNSWDVAAVTAHLGDYNIRTDFEVQHVQRRVKRLVRHKGFDFSHLHNDIAILTLSEPVKFTYEIQPICLPTSTAHQSRSYSGHTAIVAGWGSLRENGPQPSILQKVQIPIWTNSECARKYGHAAPGGITEAMLCAGKTAKDSCSGDSGGPLIVNESGRYLQIGIVSWGIGCGKGEYPGVYTRITSLLPWIYKNIK